MDPTTDDDRPAPESATRMGIARRFLDHVMRGDVRPVLGHPDPEAVYRVVGEHSLAGTFKGADEIAAHIDQLTANTSGTVEMTKWDDWLEGETSVAAVAQVTARAAGRRYSARIVYLLEFTPDDTIERITVFFDDPGAASRFFG